MAGAGRVLVGGRLPQLPDFPPDSESGVIPPSATKERRAATFYRLVNVHQLAGYPEHIRRAFKEGLDYTPARYIKLILTFFLSSIAFYLYLLLGSEVSRLFQVNTALANFAFYFVLVAKSLHNLVHAFTSTAHTLVSSVIVNFQDQRTGFKKLSFCILELLKLVATGAIMAYSISASLAGSLPYLPSILQTASVSWGIAMVIIQTLVYTSAVLEAVFFAVRKFRSLLGRLGVQSCQTERVLDAALSFYLRKMNEIQKKQEEGNWTDVEKSLAENSVREFARCLKPFVTSEDSVPNFKQGPLETSNSLQGILAAILNAYLSEYLKKDRSTLWTSIKKIFKQNFSWQNFQKTFAKIYTLEGFSVVFSILASLFFGVGTLIISMLALTKGVPTILEEEFGAISAANFLRSIGTMENKTAQTFLTLFLLLPSLCLMFSMFLELPEAIWKGFKQAAKKFKESRPAIAIAFLIFRLILPIFIAITSIAASMMAAQSSLDAAIDPDYNFFYNPFFATLGKYLFFGPVGMWPIDSDLNNLYGDRKIMVFPYIVALLAGLSNLVAILGMFTLFERAQREHLQILPPFFATFFAKAWTFIMQCIKKCCKISAKHVAEENPDLADDVGSDKAEEIRVENMLYLATKEFAQVLEALLSTVRTNWGAQGRELQQMVKGMDKNLKSKDASETLFGDIDTQDETSDQEDLISQRGPSERKPRTTIPSTVFHGILRATVAAGILDAETGKPSEQESSKFLTSSSSYFFNEEEHDLAYA